MRCGSVARMAAIGLICMGVGGFGACAATAYDDSTGSGDGARSATGKSAPADAAGANGTLVVYFSNTGHTQAVAERIADAANADLFRIKPAIPYSSADLDYNDDSSRCMKELNDPSSRPQIVDTVEDWDSYRTVFVGYPIWWGRTPPIMQTFVESYDWSGKTVVPFCTSGSSPIGSSADVLKEAAAGSTWIDGQRFSGDASADEIASWIDGLPLSR